MYMFAFIGLIESTPVLKMTVKLQMHAPTICYAIMSIYSKTSLTDHLYRSTIPLYRSIYFGPKQIFWLPNPTTCLNGPHTFGPMIGRFREVLLLLCAIKSSHLTTFRNRKLPCIDCFIGIRTDCPYNITLMILKLPKPLMPLKLGPW